MGVSGCEWCGVHTIVDVLLPSIFTLLEKKNGPRSDSNPRPADLKREIVEGEANYKSRFLSTSSTTLFVLKIKLFIQRY